VRFLNLSLHPMSVEEPETVLSDLLTSTNNTITINETPAHVTEYFLTFAKQEEIPIDVSDSVTTPLMSEHVSNTTFPAITQYSTNDIADVTGSTTTPFMEITTMNDTTRLGVIMTRHPLDGAGITPNDTAQIIPPNYSGCKVLGYSRTDCSQLVLSCVGNDVISNERCPAGMAYSIDEFLEFGSQRACSVHQRIPLYDISNDGCSPPKRKYLRIVCQVYHGQDVNNIITHQPGCCPGGEYFSRRRHSCHRYSHRFISRRDSDISHSAGI